ncbi:helix-turn-helix domain-containing protein, partial [Klebsiella pneumoniae]|nr:helix-turn-helix domain-containing protein [Klebsiella pneumoniae]
ISNKERSGWCKIPVRAITSEGGHAITPFEDLKLRRKVELHALKIFIYLASVRDNYTEYSLASYQTISSAVGITEKDIQRALALLSLVGL